MQTRVRCHSLSQVRSWMEKRSRYFLRFTTGGYNGSAHTLACELDKDTLTGVYYHAVAN